MTELQGVVASFKGVAASALTATEALKKAAETYRAAEAARTLRAHLDGAWAHYDTGTYGDPDWDIIKNAKPAISLRQALKILQKGTADSHLHGIEFATGANGQPYLAFSRPDGSPGYTVLPCDADAARVIGTGGAMYHRPL